MNTQKIDGLKEKTGRGEGITEFIRNALKSIPEGEAVYMSEVAKEVLERFPTVKDRPQAYARVSMVVTKLGMLRLEGVGKMTMVGWPKSQKQIEAEEFGIGEEEGYTE